jgi:guanylate kinase
VAERRHGGTPVLLEIEVQGARQVRQAVPGALLVFLAPPSWDVLKDRLLRRGTESPEAVERRLQAARDELAAADEFDAVLVNADVRECAEALLALVSDPTSVPRGRVPDPDLP